MKFEDNAESRMKEVKETNQRVSTYETIKLPKYLIKNVNGDPVSGKDFSIHLKLRFIIPKH